MHLVNHKHKIYNSSSFVKHLHSQNIFFALLQHHNIMEKTSDRIFEIYILTKQTFISFLSNLIAASLIYK